MSSPEKLHINCPEELSRRKRLGDAVLTGIMWGLYTYLWAPLLSLVAWLLGFEFAYDVMVRAGGLEALRSVLHWYGLMLVGIVTFVTGWSLINRMRFVKRDRRHAAAQVSDEDIAAFFELESPQLEKLRCLRIIHVAQDETGGIVSVECGNASPVTANEEAEKPGQLLQIPTVAERM